jgi:N-acylglucosamine-6-phosphate 2-epimerase
LLGESKEAILSQIRGGLVVSCQARDDNPLAAPQYILVMARAAVAGGAACIRVESPEDIRAVTRCLTVPIIGLYKVNYNDSPIYITPTLREVEMTITCGAQIVAIDATARVRPCGETQEHLRQAVDLIHKAGRLAMADISTLDEAIAAEALGFDIVATTLSGYTPYSPAIEGPDLELVKAAVSQCRVPVIAEGRFWHPETVVQALSLGAWAVTVGTAITDPQKITARFVEKIKAHG